MTLLRRLGPASFVCAVVVLQLAGAPTAQRSAVRLIPAPAAGAPAAAQSQDQALQLFRGRIADRGEVRLIVEVRTPARMAGVEPLDAQQELPDAAMIAEARQRVMRRLPPRAYPIHEFETIPFIAMAADLATFEVLRGDPDVVSIQEDFVVAPTLTQSVPLVQANLAWAAGYTGKGRTVAILDTGVEKGHAAFGGRVVSEACYSGGGSTAQSLCPGAVLASTAANSAAPCSMSLDGGACFHGTHVAGIAAGSNGVAKESSIIAIQVFSNTSGLVRAWSSDMVRGLERVYALRKKYDIASVNMSIGGGRYFATCDSATPSMAAAIANLTNYRIATVVSSGNDGYVDSMSWPACMSNAVSVGSTTKSDVVSSFSNAASFLSLLAPGGSISAPYVGGGTATASGTSMAAPHVAGAWAILEHKTPGLKVTTGLSVLKTGGLNVVDSGNGLTFKRIRINFALARLDPLLAAVTTAPSGPSTVTPAFSWNKVTAAKQYRLLVRPAAGGAAVIDTLYSSASVCGASTCSVTPPVFFTTGVTYNWWIQTIDFGKGPLSTVKSFTPSAGLPPPTTLVAPSGSSSTTPTYQWNNIGAATQYRLFVQRVSNSTVAIDTLHTSSSVCASSPCAITPGTALVAGVQYRWKVRTRNASGYGAWSGYMYFTPVALPPATTLVSPSAAVNTLTPTFTWQKVGTATSYALFVQPTAGGDASTAWWEASAACGSTTCVVTPPGSLTAGTQYRWKVRTRNAAGSGAWSTYLTFTPSAGLPGAATLISPNTALPNQFPTYRWNKVAAATRYYITVRKSTGVVFSQYYYSTDICDSTTCQVTPTTPLGAGSFSWRIQTRNSAGYGAVSAAMSFSTVSTTMSMVLTWGANPADLDSHLVTPSLHHIYYANRGSATSTPFARLDVDDVTGFGPETIFIHQAQSGSYKYYVYRFSGAGTLAGSGAQVKLYRGATLLGTYTAPATGSGNYWHVCTITNATTGARTCPNTISTVAPSVAGFTPSAMPEKKGDAGVAGDGAEGDASKRELPARPSRPKQGGPPKR